mgnify:CR=1 FL=1
MTKKDTYRTTAKGRAEVTAKPGALKPGIKGLLAAVGVAMTAAQFVGMSQPDPAVQYVAGDPAWAHVSQP